MIYRKNINLKKKYELLEINEVIFKQLNKCLLENNDC